MRVVSFNILSEDYVPFHSARDVTRYYRHLEHHELRLSARIGRICAKLAALDADVVLLQEVMTEARVALVEQFGDTHHVGPIAYHRLPRCRANRNRTGNLVLTRKGLGMSTFYSVPIGGGYQVAVATNANATVAALSVHLADTHEKHKQLTHVLRHIRDNLHRGVIVGGDFNSCADAIHRRLRLLGLMSAVTEPTGTYLCAAPMIDYVYAQIRPERAYVDNDPQQCFNRERCFSRTLSELGSDHYPVVADY